MTPLERAARALFKYEPGPYGDCVDWAIEQDFGWRDQVAAVKLVLTAIREPSEGMLDAGAEVTWAETYAHHSVEKPSQVDSDFALRVFGAMIDAALAEGD